MEIDFQSLSLLLLLIELSPENTLKSLSLAVLWVGCKPCVSELPFKRQKIYNDLFLLSNMLKKKKTKLPNQKSSLLCVCYWLVQWNSMSWVFLDIAHSSQFVRDQLLLPYFTLYVILLASELHLSLLLLPKPLGGLIIRIWVLFLWMSGDSGGTLH